MTRPRWNRRIVEKWLQSGLFHPKPEGTAEENYSIAIPPPNVTGVLHMGHALNNTVQDCLIRHPRCAGSEPSGSSGPITPGSPPRPRSSAPLSRRGRAARSSAGHVRGAGVAMARAVRRGRSSTQLKRLGASCDYDDERFTLDRAYAAGRPQGVRGALREGLHLPRPLHGQLGSGSRLGHLGPRGRGAGGHRHPLLHRLPAGSSGSGRGDRGDGPRPRRCSPTRRSPCTRTTSATGG